ncbi:MAG: hypothetical protein QOI10_1708 [Solirubrobacterales bacterium]|jgi:FkbM family methyltransferase|nr:hypothetical protein [Solirubrobacterales bacterium]
MLEQLLGSNPIRLVDVGARGGIDPRWRPFESLLELTAFEPDPDECRRLTAAAPQLSYPARFLPLAVWRETAAAVPFHICRWPVASGFYPPNEALLESFPHARELLAVTRVVEVETASLDDADRRYGLAADHLKLDVEGAELDVLIGGEDVLARALVLEVEVEMAPLFEGQPLFADVDAHLRSRGWSLHGLRRTSWRRGAPPRRDDLVAGGRLVSADALYVNEGLIEPGLALERELKYLAIMSAYGQLDEVAMRLESPRTATAGLPRGQRDQLRDELVPRATALRRLGRRLAGGLSAERRRNLADALQPASATNWQDAHFF